MNRLAIKLAASILLSLSLTACGAGVQQNEQPSAEYNVVVRGVDAFPKRVEGFGATEEDRRYDAVAYAVAGLEGASNEAYVTVDGVLYVVTWDGAGVMSIDVM